MYDRIVVPLDGSMLAAQALPYARLMAAGTGAELTLFRAIPSYAEAVRDMSVRSGWGESYTAGFQLALTRDQWEHARERLEREATEDLEEEAASLRDDGLTVRIVLAEGEPAEALPAETSRGNNPIIVMTTHGRSGVQRWWSGSVTDKVVRSAAAPTLVIRSHEQSSEPSEPTIRRIILPLDGSQTAEQAIPHAVAVARALHAGVEVIRAATAPVYIPVRYPLPEAVRNPMEAGIHAETEADRYLTAIVERLQDMGTGTARAIVVRGDAGSVITEAAEHTSDSLVVMSTHGRTGLGRWVLGSVADKVVRHSGRPVLLIRAREEAGRQAA